jgi:hypothetical protein
MAAPYIIPFNHQPVNRGTTAGTYTVPSGRYARVVASLSAYAGASKTAFITSFPSGSSPSYDCKPDSNQASIELWLRAGDVVSTAGVVASGTASFSINNAGSLPGVITASERASSRAIVRVNSADVCSVSAIVQASFAVGASFASTTYSLTYAQFEGSWNVIINYEEYNQIS